METKVCRVCGKEKDIELFEINYKKGGLRDFGKRCLSCFSEYQKNWNLNKKHPNESDRKIQSLDGEIWVSVVGYEQRYMISNLGRLKSLPHKKMPIEVLMTACKNNHGYYYFTLSINNKRNNKFQHRLIAQHFIPNPNNKPQVLHKNDTPADNRIENLEWGTGKENIEQAVSRNRMNHGEDRALCKLKENDVLYIFNSKKNNTILGNKFNVSPTACFNIKKGRSWVSLTGKKYERTRHSKHNSSSGT